MAFSLGYAPNFPPLDNLCGKHYCYRNFIECGETWRRNQVDNRPSQLQTYTAMRELCCWVLDPVVDQFGIADLHYAFASAALDKLVRRKKFPNTTRNLDQHAGCELNSKGRPYCPRLGLAVDIQVPGISSLKIAQWVIQNTGYDRLYLYGADRPLHVSVGPENAKVVWHSPFNREVRGHDL